MNCCVWWVVCVRIPCVRRVSQLTHTLSLCLWHCCRCHWLVWWVPVTLAPCKLGTCKLGTLQIRNHKLDTFLANSAPTNSAHAQIQTRHPVQLKMFDFHTCVVQRKSSVMAILKSLIWSWSDLVAITFYNPPPDDGRVTALFFFTKRWTAGTLYQPIK